MCACGCATILGVHKVRVKAEGMLLMRESCMRVVQQSRFPTFIATCSFVSLFTANFTLPKSTKKQHQDTMAHCRMRSTYFPKVPSPSVFPSSYLPTLFASIFCIVAVAVWDVRGRKMEWCTSESPQFFPYSSSLFFFLKKIGLSKYYCPALCYGPFKVNSDEGQSFLSYTKLYFIIDHFVQRLHKTLLLQQLHLILEGFGSFVFLNGDTGGE